MSEALASGDRMTVRQVEDLCGFRMPKEQVFTVREYRPPGPIGERYIWSNGPIDVIMGPAGAGKSVASIFKALRFTLHEMPVCRDGIVRAKGTVIRDNYQLLYRSTLQSWFEWFPVTLFPDFTGGKDRPGCHKFRVATVREVNGVMREVPVDLQVDFFSISDLNYEQMFKSYETSWAWANEADALDEGAVPFFYSRTERFPPLKLLPPGARLPRMLGADINPPDPKHPLYVAAKRGSFREDFDPSREPRTVNFFVQPSGLAPNAENREGKRLEAYQAEMATLPADVSRRQVEGLPGRVKDGLPVYDTAFAEAIHVAPVALPLLPGIPINIGFDQGGQSGGAGQPAAALFQVAPNGQIRFVGEVSTSAGTGVERFLDQLRPLLAVRFHGLPPGVFTCDPAGFFGGDKVYATLAWAEIVQKALGHRIDPAPTNEWTPRLEALSLPLGRSIAPGVPMMVFCPTHCPKLIEALAGDYKFGKRHDKTYDPMPMKNQASNIAEAAQYGALGVLGLTGLVNRIAGGNRGSNVHSFEPRAVVQSADWSVF